MVVDGDLSKLTPAQRVEYYARVCQSLGLNPLTRPFQYIRLNNKLTLYATRDATDQIRRRLAISVRPVRREFINDTLYVVEVEAELDGRKDFAMAAVPVRGLQDEALANAMMKCETKAKRRATLSIAGLGFLDETEIETIPDAQVVPGDSAFPSDPVSEPITGEQLKAIHAAARKLQLSDESYRQLLKEFGVQSSKQLTKTQASQLLARLKELWQQKSAPVGSQSPPNPTSLKDACSALGWSDVESMHIRAAVLEAQVAVEDAAAVLSNASSKEEALQGLATLGVPNPFRRQVL